MDEEDRDALRECGLDPDDPAVQTAIGLVRCELSLLAARYGEAP